MSTRFASFLAALPADGPLAPCPYDVIAPADIEGPLRGSLATAAREIYGPLASNECFAFVPALALGGSDSDISCVQKVDMHVHWSILAQM